LILASHFNGWKNRLNQVSQKCRWPWLILVRFYPNFDLCFAMKNILPLPMGLCRPHCQSENAEVKTSLSNAMGRPDGTRIEIMAFAWPTI